MQVLTQTGPGVVGSATTAYAFKGAKLVTNPAAVATVAINDAAGRPIATLGTVATLPSDSVMLDSPVQAIGLTSVGAFTGTLHIYVE